MKKYFITGIALVMTFWAGLSPQAATITDGGSQLDETAWFTAAYGNFAYVLADGLPASAAATSDNISTAGSGADIEYTTGPSVGYGAGGSDEIPIENETGTAVNLQLGRWYRNSIFPGSFINVISFEMISTPTSLDVGVLVGPAGSGDNDNAPMDYPTKIRLSDDGGTTYIEQTVTKPAGLPYQADWYFFNVSGIDSNTVLTVLADGQSGDSGNRNVPVSGVVFAQPVDTLSPTITTISPSDNATKVSTDGDLVLTFNEVVTAGSGNIEIRRTSSGVAANTFDVTADATFNGGVVTVSYTNLDLLAEYNVYIPSGAIKDTNNNVFAGISDEATWNFTVAGIVTNVTDWVTRGYGDYGHIFFNSTIAAKSANISTSGTDIEYTDLAGTQSNPGTGNIPIQNEAGTATDLAVGRWLDGGLGGAFADLISFAMANTVSELRIGVLVGCGGGDNPQSPGAIRLTDNNGYTNTYWSITTAGIKRPDWYFFDVTNITSSTVLTVLATKGSTGYLWNPINGVVFAPIPEAPAPPPPAGTVFIIR